MDIRKKNNMFNKNDYSTVMWYYEHRDEKPNWEIKMVSDDGSRRLTISGMPSKALDIWPDGWFMSITLDYSGKECGTGGSSCPYKPEDISKMDFETMRDKIYKGLYLPSPADLEKQLEKMAEEIMLIDDSEDDELYED